MRIGQPPRDRRTRRLALTVPGSQAIRIASAIHQDLEGHLGHPQRNAVGDMMRAIPAATILEDGLPVATA